MEYSDKQIEQIVMYFTIDGAVTAEFSEWGDSILETGIDKRTEELKKTFYKKFNTIMSYNNEQKQNKYDLTEPIQYKEGGDSFQIHCPICKNSYTAQDLCSHIRLLHNIKLSSEQLEILAKFYFFEGVNITMKKRYNKQLVKVNDLENGFLN